MVRIAAKYHSRHWILLSRSHDMHFIRFVPAPRVVFPLHAPAPCTRLRFWHSLLVDSFISLMCIYTSCLMRQVWVPKNSTDTIQIMLMKYRGFLLIEPAL